jgi:hypothetical protein
VSQLESAQTTAVRTRILSDGRIRYYEKEIFAATKGPTRGRSYVTEYNPHNNISRTGWNVTTIMVKLIEFIQNKLMDKS